LAKHVAHQPDDIDLRCGGFFRRLRAWRNHRCAIAHIKAGAAARFQKAGRHQPVVGLDNGKARDLMLVGELSYRRHACAGTQQLVIDARCNRLHDLFDQ
jgi:hypothetical protein